MSAFTRALLAFAYAAIPVLAADLIIPLPGNADISRKTIQYRCNASGTKLGLPSDVFAVEYINGGGNSLAVVPISGKPVIFVTVLSGSGARYVAQQYTWWEAKGSVTVSSLQTRLSRRAVPLGDGK